MLKKLKKNPKKILFVAGGLILLFLVVQLIQILPFIFQLIFNRDIDLKKSDSGVNVLLLGTPGGNHDGPNLTDTVILASISPERDKVELVSIPRDLWVPDLKSKINVAYASGESKRKGGGLVLAKAAVNKILNQPVDYAVRIDFDGFKRAVDLIGGLEIDVERSFDDYEYPVAGKENDPCGHNEEEIEKLATSSSQLEAFPCRYKHVHFDSGKQQMDGETALIFVRSRHARGAEGSDFARSKRQEKVIQAFRQKLFSIQTLANPAKIISLYDILRDSIDTDIKEDEFDDFIRLFQKLNGATMESTVIDAGDPSQNRAGLLINPQSFKEYNLEWVLIPRIGNGNFSEIHKYIECSFKDKEICKIEDLPN
jgi:LCP family protein required for cell wall assembly